MALSQSNHFLNTNFQKSIEFENKAFIITNEKQHDKWEHSQKRDMLWKLLLVVIDKNEKNIKYEKDDVKK